MRDQSPSPGLFGELYAAHMGEVTENLSVLKALLDRDYLLRKPEAEAYLRVCALLLLNTCRVLGEISSPAFGQGPVPSGSDDLRCRRTEPCSPRPLDNSFRTIAPARTARLFRLPVIDRLHMTTSSRFTMPKKRSCLAQFSSSRQKMPKRRYRCSKRRSVG